MERLVLVGQREAGILAPRKDVNGVSRLITDKMPMCYAFSVYDPEAEVGLLTLVDPWGERKLRKMIKNTSPLLKDLGARLVKVETVKVGNRLSKYVSVAGAIEELRNNDIEILQLTDSYGVTKDWSDAGEAYGVIFDARTGIKPYSPEKLDDVPAPEEGDVLRKRMTVKRFIKQLPQRMPHRDIQICYQPALQPNK